MSWNAEAFRDFYDANFGRVARFFVRRTGDAELAADLTADTFAIAFQQRRRFRGRTTAEAEAWLFAIARSQLSRSRRRGRAERQALALVAGDVTVGGLAELERIEERAAAEVLAETISAAVACLSAEQAYAVQQRVVFEREYDDLAAELGVSQDAVRARVSRGLRALAAAAL